MGGFREDGAPKPWRTATARQTFRLALQQRRLRRRIAGVCLECGAPRASGLLCSRHALDNRERQHKHQFRTREH